MSIKKLVILSAAGVAALASAVAFAGGPEVIPCQPPVFVPFVYIGGSAGWAYSDWNSFLFNGAFQSVTTSGFTYGGKLGYQATDHFGIEAGGYSLPASKQTFFNGTTPGGVNPITGDPIPGQTVNIYGEVDSWVAYGALTLRAAIPGYDAVHVTGKVGGAYRGLDHSGSLYKGYAAELGSVDDGGYGTVVFGATVDYSFQESYNLPLFLAVDYLFVPGSNASWAGSTSNGTTTAISANAAPAAQIVVGTIGFNFAV